MQTSHLYRLPVFLLLSGVFVGGCAFPRNDPKLDCGGRLIEALFQAGCSPKAISCGPRGEVQLVCK